VVADHSLRFYPRFTADQELSDPFDIVVHTANYGERSAQAILWNATFRPDDVEIARDDRDEPGRRRIHHEVGILIRLVVNLDHMHADSAYLMRIPLRVRRHHSRIEFTVTASCLDAPRLSQQFELLVVQADQK